MTKMINDNDRSFWYHQLQTCAELMMEAETSKERKYYEREYRKISETLDPELREIRLRRERAQYTWHTLVCKQCGRKKRKKLANRYKQINVHLTCCCGATTEITIFNKEKNNDNLLF